MAQAWGDAGLEELFLISEHIRNLLFTKTMLESALNDSILALVKAVSEDEQIVIIQPWFK